MKTDPDLWRRIAAHRFDPDDGPPGHFVAKLARDNGWAAPYTRRVVEQYRRYAYLCCTAGHVVVPSEQVDQVWHQHLLDTQPYWDIFCKQVLRRPLHHRPSKGGINDRHRHIELYEQTLASYERAFSSPPPPDIWPPAAERFGADLRHRRVRLADYWLVPRRPVRTGAAAVLLLAAGLAIAGAAPRYGAITSPFDFSGPTFLAFYVFLFGLAIAASLLFRRQLLDPMRNPSPGAFGEDQDGLDPYEAAALSTNTRLAINAAIAALEREGAISVVERKDKGLFFTSTSYRLVPNGPVPAAPRPLEAAVYEEVARRERGITLSDVHERLHTPAAALVASLQDRGLLLGPGTAGRRFLAVLPLVALAAFGLMKVVVGVSRGKPVGILVILIAIAAIVAAILIGTMRRTRRGSAALKAARERTPERKSLSRREVAGGQELAWIVALYGIGVLNGGEFGAVHSALAADASRGGGAGAASSGCGGGCGGGGGGCGGGCGGCGG